MLQNKNAALARLRAGESTASISADLNISEAILIEWKSELTDAEIVSIHVDNIASQKAVAILEEANTNKCNLENIDSALQTITLKLIANLQSGLSDAELAKALNLTANSIATLRSAFFGKSPQVIVNQDFNSESKFQELLKD